jgi:Periplasmic copper-binding protein (NosD)
MTTTTRAVVGETASGAADDQIDKSVEAPPRRLAESRIAAALLMLVCAGLIWWVFRPGYMNADTLQRLVQVRSGELTDWYDPILLWAWRVLLRSMAPSAILFLQVAGLLAGIYSVLRAHVSRLAAAGIAVGLVVSPPVLAQVMLIGRDTWLAVFAVMACGAFVRASRTEGWQALLAWFVGGVSLFGAMAARQNALPLVVALVAPFVWRAIRQRAGRVSGLGRAMLLVLATGLVTVLAVAAVRVGERMVGAARTNVEAGVYTYDLAAMSLRVGELLLDATIFPAQDLQGLRESFDPSLGVGLVLGDEPALDVRVGSIPDDHAATLERDWRRAVRDHPLAYLQARGDFWFRLIGMRGDTPSYVVHLGVDPLPLGYALSNPTANDVARRYLGLFAEAPFFVRGGLLFQPWLYLLVALGTAAWLLRRHRDMASRVVASMAIGGVAYECTFLLAGGSAYYRYSYPMIVCGLVASMFAIATAIVHRSAARLSSDPGRRASRVLTTATVAALAVVLVIVVRGVAANASTLTRSAVPFETLTVVHSDGDATKRGSLPWALARANARHGLDYIRFDPSVGTVLIDAPLIITDLVNIDGATSSESSSGTRISASGGVDRLVVLADGSEGSTVSHLVLDGFTDVGIDVESTSSGDYLVSNRIEVPTRNAVGISVAADRTSVLGNVVRGSGVGVRIAGDAASDASGNGLTGNQIEMCGADSVAVLVAGGAYNWVGTGNAIFGSRGVVVQGTTAIGNSISTNSIGSSAGETCPVSMDVGVMIVDGSTGNGVVDNEFSDIALADVVLEQPASAHLDGNTSTAGELVVSSALVNGVTEP